MTKLVMQPLQSRRMGTFLFILCWIAYFTAQLGRLNYSVALTGIVDGGLLDKSTAGLIGTAFYLCYGAGQLLSGFLGDIVSPFLLLFAGLCGTAAANLGMSFLQDVGSLAVVWGLNGIAQSLLWTPVLALFARVLPESQRKSACVNIATTTPVGMLACYALSNLMLTRFGWQAVFSAASIPLFLAAAVFGIGALRVSRRWHADNVDAEPMTAAVEASPDRPAQKNPHSLARLMILSGVLWMMLPIAIQSVLKDGMTTWTPTMLIETFSVSPDFAINLTMILPIAGLLGGYAGSFVNSRWLRHELKTAIFFFLVSLPALLLILARWNIWLSTVALGLVVFSMYAVNMMIITFVPVRFGKYGRTSSISGILNATAYLGGAVSTYGIGFVAEYFGWELTILLWVLLCAGAILLCSFAVRRWTRFGQAAA